MEPVIIAYTGHGFTFLAPDTPLEREGDLRPLAENAVDDEENIRDETEYESGDIVALHAYNGETGLDAELYLRWDADDPTDVYRITEVAI